MSDHPNPQALAEPPTSRGNPHILWRQILGFVLWVGLISLLTGGPFAAALCLLLGGATFTDAWISGIYKHPDKKNFLNISPMAWGIAMAMLFVVAYPAYVFNRRKLRTKPGTDTFFWITTALGAIVLVLFILTIAGRIASQRA